MLIFNYTIVKSFEKLKNEFPLFTFKGDATRKIYCICLKFLAQNYPQGHLKIIQGHPENSSIKILCYLFFKIPR